MLATRVATRVAGARCTPRVAVEGRGGGAAVPVSRRREPRMGRSVHTATTVPVRVAAGAAGAATARRRRAVRVAALPEPEDSSNALAKLEMETELNLLGMALAVGVLSGAAVVRLPPGFHGGGSSDQESPGPGNRDPRRCGATGEKRFGGGGGVVLRAEG
jgi:hypothetical protein